MFEEVYPAVAIPHQSLYDLDIGGVVACQVKPQEFEVGFARFEAKDTAGRRNDPAHRQGDQPDMAADIEYAIFATASLDGCQEAVVVALAPGGEITKGEVRIQPEGSEWTDMMFHCRAWQSGNYEPRQTAERNPDAIEARKRTVA